MICSKHDLGYRSNAEPHMIPESKQGFGKGQEFWKIIGGQEKYLGKMKIKPLVNKRELLVVFN